MWTPTTRAQHSRTGLRCGSDVTDAEWLLLSPFLPAPSPRRITCDFRTNWRKLPVAGPAWLVRTPMALFKCPEVGHLTLRTVSSHFSRG